MRALGLPTQTTIAKLAPQLKALGLDPAQLSATLLLKLSGADRGAVQSALSQPIGLRYVVSVKTQLLVEPKTGATVSLHNINQTLGVQPSFAGLGQIGAILNRPQYQSVPAVKIAAATLAQLAKSPPTARVFNPAYGQTPASVADIASYTKSKADGIDMVKTTIPLVLLLAGVLSAAVGLGIFFVGRRGQGKGLPGGPPAGEPAGSRNCAEVGSKRLVATVTERSRTRQTPQRGLRFEIRPDRRRRQLATSASALQHGMALPMEGHPDARSGSSQSGDKRNRS